MAEREDPMTEFSDEELEALGGEELSDRKAMSTLNGDSTDLAGLGVDDLGDAASEDEP
ncbi:MAG: hypothetical protein H0V20_09790 [Actinobacteria bacterium]|nr:hypothetical protein [Actinomycetota bacterium]